MQAHVYRIRPTSGTNTSISDVFTNLVLALNFAQEFATLRRVRLEIVREDGTVAIAVEPDDPSNT